LSCAKASTCLIQACDAQTRARAARQQSSRGKVARAVTDFELAVQKDADASDTSAFTRVFDALCAGMTIQPYFILL
jgi:hypothetical protein